MIKQVLSKYTQKSRVFLFPLLGYPRISVTNPIQTYTSWDGKYKAKDMRLICEYANRQDEEFKNFETKKLLGHVHFLDFYQSENDTGLYVFDLSAHKDTWNNVHNGMYSMISNEDKLKIRKYFSTNSSSAEHIDSYLNPEKYYSVYAGLLNVEESLLREVGELCSKPDLKQEKLIVKIKDVQLF
jgi:hypothetical protein